MTGTDDQAELGLRIMLGEFEDTFDVTVNTSASGVLLSAKHDRNNMASSLRIEVGGRVLVFSGDTGWQPELGRLTEGADLFITECTGVDEEYWGHLSVDDIIAHRHELLAKRVVLSHLSDASRRVATAKAASMNVEVADDGLVIEIP